MIAAIGYGSFDTFLFVLGVACLTALTILIIAKLEEPRK